MALDFDDLLQDTAHQGSPFLVAKTIVRAVGDVFLSAVRERFAMLHGDLDITPRVNAAIAIASAHEYQSCGVSADGRLLIGLATEQHGLAGIVLRELGIHANRLRASFREAKSSTEHNATVDEPDADGASVSFVRQLTNAAECARTFGHGFIGTEHLALSLLAETNGDAARLIERLGVDPNSLRDVLAERTRQL
jgi:ATP-dependent Clp protease ATP-binding subunit ClpA